MSRLVLEPTAEHPITIEPTAGRVVVRIAGRVVADTSAALTLEEAGYDPVQYIPPNDIDQAVLRLSKTTTYCPYKGDAGYFSVNVPGRAPLEDVAWFYAQPYTSVAEIADHVAFYADRAEVLTATRGEGVEMNDSTIAERIERLVTEEAELRAQEARDSEHPNVLEHDKDRLREVEVELDRCWDLLRQRRALRNAGGNPDDASAHDAGTVEDYLQ
jgi:uncharacterized protein (DUF427 family)